MGRRGQAEFSRRAAELDALELEAAEAIAGPSDALLAKVRAAEDAFEACQPASLADWPHLARRLAGALENGWTDQAAAGLLELAA